MPLRDMVGDMMGRIPKLSAQLARTLLNEALTKIYSDNDWSFNYVESGWLTQNSVSAGTITAVVGSEQIVGDATAASAWAGVGFGLTRMQIRCPAYALYSVVAFDGVNTLTLDRPWLEPDGTRLTYLMYQAYYPAPVQDFKRWITVRDTANAHDLDFDNWTRQDLATADAQRTIFGLPSCVVPYKTDDRLNSATPGWMLYELYPHPLQRLPYALFCKRLGAPLVNPGDTVPYPLTEELVRARARALAYEWKESQKGQETHRGSGADYRFLMEAAMVFYKERIQDVRKIDRNLADEFIGRIKRYKSFAGPFGSFYSPITGRVGIGGF